MSPIKSRCHYLAVRRASPLSALTDDAITTTVLAILKRVPEGICHDPGAKDAVIPARAEETLAAKRPATLPEAA